MKIHFLGTCSGLPTPQRQTSGSALEFKDGRIWVMDCGEGTYKSILCTNNLNFKNVEVIFLTHLHGDHIFGLFNILRGITHHCRSNFVDIVGPLGIKELLQTVFKIADLELSFPIHIIELDEKSETVISPKSHSPFDLPNLQFRGMDIRAFPLSHRIRSFAYFFEIPKNAGEIVDNNSSLTYHRLLIFGDNGNGYNRKEGEYEEKHFSSLFNVDESKHSYIFRTPRDMLSQSPTPPPFLFNNLNDNDSSQFYSSINSLPSSSSSSSSSLSSSSSTTSTQPSSPFSYSSSSLSKEKEGNEASPTSSKDITKESNNNNNNNNKLLIPHPHSTLPSSSDIPFVSSNSSSSPSLIPLPSSSSSSSVCSTIFPSLSPNLDVGDAGDFQRIVRFVKERSSSDPSFVIDTMVHEITYSKDREASALRWGHSTTVNTAKRALELGAQTLITTHYSYHYITGTTTPPSHINEVIDYVEGKVNVLPAYDGFIYDCKN